MLVWFLSQIYVCAHNATNAICRHRKLSFVRMWRFTLFLGQCTKIIMVSVPDIFCCICRHRKLSFFLCGDPDYFWDDVLILEAVAAAAIFKHIFATKKLELSIQSFCSGMECQQKAKQKTSPQSLREKMCPTSRNIFFSDTI